MTLGKWEKIPESTMEIYIGKKAPSETNREIETFVDKYDCEKLWEFLFTWREFLEKQCNTKLPGPPPQVQPLKMWLEHMDIDENMVGDFPDNVMLTHAGRAYVHAAHFFEENEKRRR